MLFLNLRKDWDNMKELTKSSIKGSQVSREATISMELHVLIGLKFLTLTQENSKILSRVRFSEAVFLQDLSRIPETSILLQRITSRA
jgi:hypothetical protein